MSVDLFLIFAAGAAGATLWGCAHALERLDELIEMFFEIAALDRKGDE